MRERWPAPGPLPAFADECRHCHETLRTGDRRAPHATAPAVEDCWCLPGSLQGNRRIWRTLPTREHREDRRVAESRRWQNQFGNSVGRSFRLCTARSTLPSARASSISLVNMPFVPTCPNATSCRRSPVVRMISMETSWPAWRSASAMWLDCQSANCDPREPIRITSASI